MNVRAIVGGLGLPGYLLSMALLRQGHGVLACDPKKVTERTLARVYGPADLDTFKTDALVRAADELGRRELLATRTGKIEDVVGGLELRETGVIFLAADRPSATWRTTELCAQLATPEQPITLLTGNVGDGAAQVRNFRFPLDGAACPVCGSGRAYVAARRRDAAYSCDDSGNGDPFTVPFGASEAYLAAGLALRAQAGPFATDTTLALSQPPQLWSSRLSPDPDCPLGCAALEPWPQPLCTMPSGAPLAEALPTAASRYGLQCSELRVRFLREVALGRVCQCLRRPRLSVLSSPCPKCSQPAVSLQGSQYELPLATLRHYDPTASPASLGLPDRDLLLLTDATGHRLAVTVVNGGVSHD